MPQLAEQFATHANLSTFIGVYAIGEKMQLSNNESRKVAGLLEISGWAVLDKSRDSLSIRLTLLGNQEVAKLRRPKIVRWIDDNPAVGSAAIAAVITVAANILIELLKRAF